MKAFFYIIVFATFSIFQSSAYARVGTDQGNGGDLYSAEFVEVAQKVADLLRNNHTRNLDIQKLQNAVNHVKVESTNDALTLKGVPKDAINYPAQHRIIFSRQRWDQLDSGEKPVLVLHEYLGILGFEDASYSFSKTVLGAFTYDGSYGILCKFDGSSGDLNLGIDETSRYGDLILMGINWSDGTFTSPSTGLPLGQFSQMIRDGNLSMTFEDKYLISLHAGSKPLQMIGNFAGEGKVIPLTCTIKQGDMSAFK